jgi:hypothetical protein
LVRLPPIWLMLNHDAPRRIVLGWEATAHAAAKRVRGNVTVPVADRLAEPAELLAEPKADA